MLICDRHDSHITGNVIGYYMDNNILLILLPPHSSHVNQLLNVGIFGTLKKVMTLKMESFLKIGVSYIQKVE